MLHQNVPDLSPCCHCHSLKRKWPHFEEIFITVCIGSCKNDNFQRSQWWEFRQNGDILLSVLLVSLLYYCDHYYYYHNHYSISSVGRMYCYCYPCHYTMNYSDVIMSTMVSQITGVSIVCSTVCSDADHRKHQSFSPLAIVRGLHRWPVDPPHKGPITRKMLPFDDVITNRDFISLPWLLYWWNVVYVGAFLTWGCQIRPAYLDMIIVDDLGREYTRPTAANVLWYRQIFRFERHGFVKYSRHKETLRGGFPNCHLDWMCRTCSRDDPYRGSLGVLYHLLMFSIVG